MKQHRKHIWKRGLVSFLAAMLVLNLCAPAVMTRAEELSGQDPASQTPAAAGQGAIPMTWEDLGKLLEQGITAAKTTPDDTANKGSSEETPGEGATGEGTTGEGTSGVGTTGEGTTGEGTSGEGATGEGTTGEGTSGEGTTGEGTTGEGTTGEGTSGEGTTGEGTTGEGTSGEGTTGEGATGEGTSGEGTTGEGTTGEGTSGEGTEPAEGTQELLNYLLSARTYEELDAMMENMSEEDYVVLNQFNEEQNAALSAHVDKLSNQEITILADMSIEQGTSGTRTEENIEDYGDYRIQQNGYTISSESCGITLSDNQADTITVTVSETTPVGEYTIQYGNEYSSRWGTYFSVAGEFTIEVTAKITSEGSTAPDKNMTFDKTVTSNENGNYDLKLTLSGAVGSETQKAKLDILFIVDTSGSMKQEMSSDNNTRYPYRRIDYVASAIKSLVDTVSENSEKLDVNYSLVQFDGPSSTKGYGSQTSDASTLVGWTSNGQSITSVFNSNYTPVNGTNYEAGIKQGITQLNASSRSDAQKIVIFLTDGNPTAANNQQYSESKNSTFMNAASTAIAGLSCNQFYCIGAGPDFSSGEVGANNLNTLISSVGTGTGATAPTTKKSYLATNTTELNSAFEDITANTLYFLCENVTITDTLNHVGGTTALDRMVEVTDVSTVNVTVYQGDTIIAGPAKEVTLNATETNAQATLTASYDQTTGVLKLDFPDTYQLEADYTYVLSAEIAPTEKAYEEFRNGGYTESGQSNTGTHSGQFGFYSNDGATVTYTYNGVQSTDAYAHPVIQLHPGKLVINKTIEGLTEEQIPEISFHVALTYPGATSATEVDIPLSEFTLKNGTYTREFAGLSPGTTYTVTENNYQVDGYNVTTTVNGQENSTATGSVAKDTTVTLNFTNAYSLANTTITLDKNVAGNMASHTDEFIFNVTIDGEAYTGNPIKLTHLSDPVQITVPIGAKVTITEQASGSYIATATVDNTKADLSGEIDKTLTIESVATEGHSVVFTNTNEKVVETGIHTDTYATYVMMSAMIVLAGFLMLGKARYTGKF